MAAGVPSKPLKGEGGKVEEIRGVHISAMAFYHKNGFVPAWKHATRFAGAGGRIGTLPDIINARLAAELGSIPWERYFTTLTAEYSGVSRGGNRIFIVAHGVGPMSTLDGILKAYSWEYKDKSRNRRGGRISREEFLKLEDGFYGPVEIVDAERIMRNKYPFLTFLDDEEAAELDMSDLVHARLGPRWLEYLDYHANIARRWHAEEGHGAIRHPIIIKIGDALNCSYRYTETNDDQAIAHLLAISGLGKYMLSVSDYPNAVRGGNLACEVDCHEWWNSVRLVGIRAGITAVTSIHPGPDNVSDLLWRNWQQLMKPVSQPANTRLRNLIEIAEGIWFTQYHKNGARMDTGEPEFHATSLEKIGGPVEFMTSIGGYYGFFKYDIKEVLAIAPRDANAYMFVSDPEIVVCDGNPKYHRALVQFYQAKIDTSQRLIREDELCNDYETLMSLVLKN